MLSNCFARSCAGRNTLKRAPPPGRSKTCILPPCARTMDWQMASPRPLPGRFDCRAGCLRKNGSNMQSRSSRGMPGPSSSTLNSNSPSSVWAEMPMGVAGGEYLIAFWRRLANTRSIWFAFIRTSGRHDAICRRTVRSASKPRIRWSAPSITEPASVVTVSAPGALLPSGVPVATPRSAALRGVQSSSTSCASRSVSRSISARKSLRVSSSHSMSARRRLVTNPLI